MWLAAEQAGMGACRQIVMCSLPCQACAGPMQGAKASLLSVAACSWLASIPPCQRCLWTASIAWQACRSGKVFRLCPVAPFGMPLPSMLVRQQLRPGDDTPAAILRWLQEATGNAELGAPAAELRQRDFWRDVNAEHVVQRHSLQGVELALVVRCCAVLVVP